MPYIQHYNKYFFQFLDLQEFNNNLKESKSGIAEKLQKDEK